MNLLSWLTGKLTSNVLENIKNIVDDFITTDQEKLEYLLKKAELDLKKYELEIKEKEIDAQLIQKVHETNIAEAQSHSLFIAGWRPFIGWVCGFALAYSFVLAPFLHSFFETFGVSFSLPELDIGILLNLILGMLGLAGLRTYEKLQNVQNRH